MTADQVREAAAQLTTIMPTVRAAMAEVAYLVEARDQRRCTGRTSRLIRDAVILALSGQVVLLVLPTHRLATMCVRSQLKYLVRKLRLPPSIRTAIHAEGIQTWEAAHEQNPAWIVMADHSCFENPRLAIAGINLPPKWDV